jgi:hypothetical protein
VGNQFDNDGAIEQAGGAASTSPANEVNHYLDSDIEQVKSKDLITWWKFKACMYPCLSCMALDYLSIPGELATIFLQILSSIISQQLQLMLSVSSHVASLFCLTSIID